MNKRVVIAVVVAAIVLIAVAVPLVNNACAAANRKQLETLSLPAGTARVETISYTGRLIGEGDGVQFWAAMLIESTQPFAQLESYYTSLGCFIQKQRGVTVDRVDNNVLHAEMSFDTILDADKTYYIVYKWGKGIPPFTWLDIRGV